MRTLVLLALSLFLCGFTQGSQKETTTPNQEVWDFSKRCNSKYLYSEYGATELWLQCGDDAGIIWSAEGIDYPISLQWISDAELKVTHPQGLTISRQLTSVDILDADGNRLKIEYDPPYKEPQQEPPLDETNWPTDCDTAAKMIFSELDEKSKATLKETRRSDLIMYHHGWGMGIRNHYGLWRGNKKLLNSCLAKEPNSQVHPDSASIVIIELVWELVQND